MAGPASETAPPRPGRGFGLKILANRSRGVAPAGMMFVAHVPPSAGGRPFHDLRYRWRFGDAGIYDLLAEDMPWSRERDLAYGPIVAHAWDRPGRYAVTCEATDGTGVETATLMVAIDDPDEVFAGGQTICVSAAGNFSGAPPGARRASTIAEAQALAQKAAARILLRRGERIEGSGTPFRHETLQIGAFGEGPAPVLGRTDDRHAIDIRKVPGDLAIWGLRLEGPYDAARPQTTIRPGGGIRLKGGAFTTIHGCSLTGWRATIGLDGGQENVVISNCHLTNWNSAGLWAPEAGWVGVCGTAIKQNPRTERARNTSKDTHAYLGPFRCSRPTGPWCFNLVDLYSNNDWSAANNKRSIQPCLRWNGNGIPDRQFSVDRMRSEGGGLESATHGGNPETPVDCLMDKVFHINTGSMTQAVKITRGGTTIRNAVVVQPDVPAEVSTGNRTMVAAGCHEAACSPANRIRPVEVYNVTFADLRRPDYARNSLLSDQPSPLRDFVADDPLDIPFENFYFANNAFYVPHLDVEPGGPAKDSGFDLEPAFASPHIGQNWEGVFDPLYATPPESTASFRPLPGSPVIGAASGKAAIDDFHGRLRGTPASRGALEP